MCFKEVFCSRYCYLALGLLFFLGACNQPALYQQESYVFGTRVQITVYGLPHAVAAKYVSAALQNLDRLHTELHAWEPSSLTQMNKTFAAGQPVEVSLELFGLLKQAQDYARRSDHLFNPAMSSLVGLWGFHSDTYVPVIPDKAHIAQQLAAHPTLDDLDFNGTQIISRNPSVAIDLGGFAKGWALDRIAAYFRKNHVYNALINVGGNIMALGQKGDRPWKVGLQHPRESKAMALVELQDGESLGTSGDYQRFFIKEGIRYSHLIDPRTGYPASTMQAAIVIAPPSTHAGVISEVATKPIFIGGIDHAMTYIKRFGLHDVLLVSHDGSIYETIGMQNRLEWLTRPPHRYRLR